MLPSIREGDALVSPGPRGQASYTSELPLGWGEIPLVS